MSAQPESSAIAAFVPDLMDRSRFGGLAIDFVTAPADLTTHSAGTVVVDLGRPGVLEVLTHLAERRVVGFASHVDTDLLNAAREAGCDEVLARSKFFSNLGAILGQE